MSDNVLKSYLISLGFKTAGQEEAKRSVKDYERAVVQAEKAIEDARWAGAKSQEEIAKLTRETNLKLAREALNDAKAREKTEAEAAKKRKERQEEFARGMASMALAAAAAAAAVGYAVEKWARSIDSLGFQAQRAGTSVQSLKGIGHAFEQVGGSAAQAQAAVDSFATKTRNNPGLRQFLADRGVDNNLPAVDRYLAALDSIKNEPREVGVQFAEMLGISEENYDLFMRQGDALIKYRREYQAMSGQFRNDSDENAKAAATLERTLGRLAMSVGVLGEKLAAALTPALTRVVEAIRSWIDANPEAIARVLDLIKAAADGVATAFERISSWLVGDEGTIHDRLERIADQAERFARAIKDALAFLKPIIDLIVKLDDVTQKLGTGALATMMLRGMGVIPPEAASGGAPGTSADTRNVWQRNAPTWLGGKEAPGPTGGTPSVSSAGSLTRLVEVEAAKAGIDPRIMHGIRAGESGKRQNGDNPAAAYDRKDDAIESSWGPFQLNRRKGLGVQFEKETGLDVRDPATIPDQVRWVAEGLKKNGRSWLRNWMGYRGDRDADPKWGDSGYVPTTTARAQGSGTNVEGGVHPLDGAGRLTSDFGMRTHPILGGRRMHAGIDLAAQAGTNVKSMTDGLVTIGASGDVTVKNPDGSSRTYRHVVPNVADGARVAAGQVIAQLRAHDRRSTGPHLHLEARDKDGNLIDPKELLRAPPAVARPRSNTPPAAAPNMTPGGFDVNAATRPALPAGIGGGSISNATSNDNRAVHQTFNSTTTVNGAERPEATAAAVGRADRDNHALAFANAQRAIA